MKLQVNQPIDHHPQREIEPEPPPLMAHLHRQTFDNFDDDYFEVVVNSAKMSAKIGGVADVYPLLTYTAANLTEGQAYAFEVSAANSYGSSASTISTPVTKQPSYQVPHSIENLQIKTLPDMINVQFTPPSNNGGRHISQYKVQVDKAIDFSSGFGGKPELEILKLSEDTSLVHEVQLVTVVSQPGYRPFGTFVLSFLGAQTPELDFNISAAGLKTELELLPTIYEVSVERSLICSNEMGSNSCDEDLGYTWAVTVLKSIDEGVLRETPEYVEQDTYYRLVASGTFLQSCDVTAATTPLGDSCNVDGITTVTIHTKQEVQLLGVCASQTTTITFMNQSAVLASGADAAALKTLLQGLIGVGQVSVKVNFTSSVESNCASSLGSLFEVTFDTIDGDVPLVMTSPQTIVMELTRGTTAFVQGVQTYSVSIPRSSITNSEIYVRVIGSNTIGDSEAIASEVYFVTPIEETPSNYPMAVTVATYSTTEIEVTWTLTPVGENSTIEIELDTVPTFLSTYSYCGGMGHSSKYCTPVKAFKSFTVTGVTNGTSFYIIGDLIPRHAYYTRVRTCNSASHDLGNVCSPWSFENYPAAPSSAASMSAPPTVGYVSMLQINDTAVSIEWTNMTTNPYGLHGSALESYSVVLSSPTKKVIRVTIDDSFGLFNHYIALSDSFSNPTRCIHANASAEEMKLKIEELPILTEVDVIISSQTRKKGGKKAAGQPLAACPSVQYIRNNAIVAVYKRLTMLPSSFDAHEIFTGTRSSTPDNNLNSDFEIYDDYSEMLASDARWNYCNYDYTNIGFPLDCGKDGTVVGKCFAMGGVIGLTSGASLHIQATADCPITILNSDFPFQDIAVTTIENVTAPGGCDILVDIKAAAFNIAFAACPIVQCTRNNAIVAIYKRLTITPATFNAYRVSTSSCKNQLHILNTDFEIFNGLMDMLADTNRWNHCDTRNSPIAGSPSNCGKNYLVADRFFVMDSNAPLNTKTNSSHIHSAVGCPILPGNSTATIVAPSPNLWYDIPQTFDSFDVNGTEESATRNTADYNMIICAGSEITSSTCIDADGTCSKDPSMRLEDSSVNLLVKEYHSTRSGCNNLCPEIYYSFTEPCQVYELRLGCYGQKDCARQVATRHVTASQTSIPSNQPSSNPSGTPTIQPSSQSTSMPSTQPSMQPSTIPSAQPSGQPTVQPTGIPTMQPSSQPTRQPSMQPIMQPSVQSSTQPSTQPPMQPSTQPSGQPSGRHTSQPSSQPSDQPSQQPSFQLQPTTHPSTQPSIQPSRQPTTQPSMQPSAQPSMQPSMQPSAQPSRQPSKQPSTQPTSRPSMQPSTQSSMRPSVQPSSQPSSQPSTQPSQQLSSQPSSQPSVQPSIRPTTQPSSRPTMQPSSKPSTQPSMQPTTQPSKQPSIQPSSQPSMQPSAQPSSVPSMQPSSQPTTQPSAQPSMQPWMQPSSQPSTQPSTQPTTQPTSQPSMQPSNPPSNRPTSQPSCQPSARLSVQPSSKPTMQPSRQPSAIPTMQPRCFHLLAT